MPKKIETATLYTVINRHHDRDMDGNHCLVRYYRTDEPLLMRLKRAVYTYLCTDKGKKHVEGNNGEFNWGDALDVPVGFLKAEGILSIKPPVPPTPCTITVDHDENLAYELRTLPKRSRLSKDMENYFWAEIANKKTYNTETPCTLGEACDSYVQMPTDILREAAGNKSLSREEFGAELEKLVKEWTRETFLLSLLPASKTK